MHIQLSTWTAACLAISSIPTATAFYPIQPKYGDNTNSNGKARRYPSRLQPTTAESRESVTLPLRRLPNPLRRDNIYNIVNSNDPTQTNSVAIDQDGGDNSYMVAVTIGDSKEEYHLLLDSAASNTWVMGQDCTTDACGTHNLFGQGDSSSLKTESTTFSVTYGTGTVSGTLASDTLHIGSVSPSVTFGLATNVSDEFKSYPMDGILGIGRGDNVQGTIEAPQVMDVLKTSNIIGAKLYGIHLNRGKDGVLDGELNLGEPNKERYDGDLNYMKIVENDSGFWEIGVDNVGVDGTELGIAGKSAIIDTGTSFILMPEPDATSVHDLIPNYKKSGETYTVPCDTTQVVWLEFGGQKYNISTKDYIGGEAGDGNCKSNIIGRKTFGDNQWLVGDVFLKNVYSVFDFDNSQVGFGVKGGEQETPTSASSGTPTATPTPGESSSPSSTPVTAAPSDSSSAGSSSTGSASPTNPTAEALDTPGASASPSPTGAASSISASSFALSAALGVLVMFI